VRRPRDGGLRLPGRRPRIWWWRLRPEDGECLDMADRGIMRPDRSQTAGAPRFWQHCGCWSGGRVGRPQRGRAREGAAPLVLCEVWWSAGSGRWWSSFTRRNPVSSLCWIQRRRCPRASHSFLEASLLCAAPPLFPWPWLRRETSNLRDSAMKASSRLLPPWGHRLGAGLN
jgi:hypothetical protein